MSGLRIDNGGKRSSGMGSFRVLLAFMVLLLLGACAGPGAQPTPTPGLDLSATETPPAPEPVPNVEPAPTNTRAPMLTATPRPTAPATATRRPTTVPTGPTAPPVVLTNPTKLTRVGLEEEEQVYSLVAVGGAAGNIVFVAGKGVLRSADGGATWVEELDQEDAPNVTTLVVAPSKPEVVYVGISEGCSQTRKSPGYASRDGGLTWGAIGNNLRSIAVDPKNHALVYGVDCTGLVRSTNEGRTWSAMLDAPVPAEAMALVAVAPSSSQVLYLAVESGAGKMKILRSADRGKTWAGVTPKIEQTAKVGQELPGAEANIAATSPLALVVDATNSAVVLVSTGFGIFRTRDAGETWTMTSEGLEDTVPPAETKAKGRINTALVGDPSKAGAFWVGTGASNVEGVGVYRTRDRGETWSKPISGLEGKRVLSLALGGVVGNRLLYIATDDGLWMITAP